MVWFPSNTWQVFSSGLNMWGRTVRDALVFTIGRALMKTKQSMLGESELAGNTGRLDERVSRVSVSHTCTALPCLPRRPPQRRLKGVGRGISTRNENLLLVRLSFIKYLGSHLDPSLHCRGWRSQSWRGKKWRPIGQRGSEWACL